MAFFNFGRKDYKPKADIANNSSDKITKEILQEESIKEKIEQKLFEIEKLDTNEKEFEDILALIIKYTKLTKDFGCIEEFLNICIEKEIFITANEKNMQLCTDIVKLVSINSISIKRFEILSKISNLKIVSEYVHIQKAFNESLADKIIEAFFELNGSQYIEKIPFMNKIYVLKRMIEISKEKNKFDILVSYLLKIELHEKYNSSYSYFFIDKGEYYRDDIKDAIELSSEAIELSIDELTKDLTSSDSISYLVNFGNKYPPIYENKKIFDYILSVAKRTDDFNFIIDKYPYNDEIVDVIINSSDKTQDFSFVMKCFNKIGKYGYEISDEKVTKITKYLLSIGKISEVINVLESNYYKDSVLVSFFEYCVLNDNEQNLKHMIKYIKKRRTYHNYLTNVDKEKLFKVLIDLNIAESDIANFVIILFLEADTILEDYKEVNFLQNPEVELSLNSLNSKNGNNYPKFHTSIKKIIKSGKPTLALYILNNHGGYNSQSDAKLWVDSYVESFMILERVDILAKYYIDFVISSQNIELLQSIAQYYIKEKKPQKALTVIEDMTKLESTYPFIQTARDEIDRLTMIEELSQNDLDVDSINTLTGEDFERLLMQKFEELGFKVIETPRTRDFGADIIVDTKDETRFVIQCKRFKSKVNLKAVQEVVGALPHYGGDIGIVITNSGFLSSAIKLAESNDIELWDNLRLMKFLTGDISFSQLSEL